MLRKFTCSCNIKIKEMKTNILGLAVKESEVIANELNILLSNFQVYYQNLRGIHWNIRGKRFFDLHVKFEELYTDSQIKIDLIAERVLTVGGTPLHTFEDYIQNNQLVVGKNISNDEKAVQLIVTSLSHLLKMEREILTKSSEINDEGTNAMMSDFIAEQEKTIWMMQAWLEESL
jgi:starvation-inducible DNA-binding protein